MDSSITIFPFPISNKNYLQNVQRLHHVTVVHAYWFVKFHLIIIFGIQIRLGYERGD